jgi:hypothetical protein
MVSLRPLRLPSPLLLSNNTALTFQIPYTPSPLHDSLILGILCNAEASRHGYGKRTYFGWAAFAAMGSE